MADKKKIEISIEGDASSLDQSTQASKGYIERVKTQVILLITQLKIAAPEFVKFGNEAVRAMMQASTAAYGLIAPIINLGVQLGRLTANYLGLTVWYRHQQYKT